MASHSSNVALPAFLQQSKADIQAKFVDLEWQQRHRLLQGTQASDPSSPWARLTGDAVASRNRYINVEPFAQNRVRLRVGEGMNDYINASHVVVGQRRFIATQGPKDTNVNHFYRMIAAEVASPAVVVMLTQTHEAGKEKCFQYFPLSPSESPLVIPHDVETRDGFSGEVVLEKIEEDRRSRCQIRSLSLRTRSNHGPVVEKEIKHLLFGGWPDFLVPEGDDRVALLELVRLSASLNHTPSSFSSLAGPTIPFDRSNHAAKGTFPSSNPNNNSLSERYNIVNGGGGADAASNGHLQQQVDNPRIIHCSAGVGRSGTFIALDALLAALRAGDFDDLSADRDPVAETVDLLRQQRMMMVQGESQFVFLYDVLREQMAERLSRKARR